MKNSGKAKPKRKVRKSFIAVLTVFLISTLLILCMTVLFPINTVKVEYNGQYYTSKEIKQSSGVRLGDNLIMLSAGSVADKLQTELPYIGKLTVKKQFPDTVVLNAEETSEYYCLPYGKKYCCLDSNFKVLKITKEYSESLVCVNGIKLKQAEPGKTAVFENERLQETLAKICKSLKKHKVSAQYIDFSVITDVKLYINERNTVLLGTTADLDEKLDFLYRVIDDMEKKNKQSEGTVNLSYYSSKKEGYFTRGEFKIEYFKEKSK